MRMYRQNAYPSPVNSGSAENYRDIVGEQLNSFFFILQCVCVCVRVCVRACVRACVCARMVL